MWFKKKPVAVEVFIFNKEAEVMAPKWFLKAIQNEKIFIDRRLEDERSVVYGMHNTFPVREATSVHRGLYSERTFRRDMAMQKENV